MRPEARLPGSVDSITVNNPTRPSSYGYGGSARPQMVDGSTFHNPVPKDGPLGHVGAAALSTQHFRELNRVPFPPLPR